MKPSSLSILLFAAAFLALPTTSFSQAQDLTADSAFFQRQSQVYQKWLDNADLGKLLRVHSVKVKPEYVALYLQFLFSDPDSVGAAWVKLKKDFEQRSAVLSKWLGLIETGLGVYVGKLVFALFKAEK